MVIFGRYLAVKHHLNTESVMRRNCIFCGNIVCRHMDIDDAGKRMSDIINNIRTQFEWDDIKNGWLAFALEDGSGNGTIYDTKDDAIRHFQNAARKFFYLALRNCIHGITAKEATLVLAMHRAQAERGRYNPSVADNISPLTTEDYAAELVSTKLNTDWVMPELANRILLP